MKDWYRQLGVSAHKGFLRALSEESEGFFTKVLPDIAGDPTYRFLLHADGIGTRGILAYLWWKETGDASVWASLAQDALVMNTDDLACAGATEEFVISTILTRNALRIPDVVVQQVIEGVYACVEWLNEIGISASVAGGETADMTDVVRTLGLEAVVAVRLRAENLIPIRRPEKRALIVGMASYGQATYERFCNSGIGCNGLTAARHLLLSSDYAQKYPETIESGLSSPYQGRYHLHSDIGGELLGRLLLSPTRTYLPVLQEIYRHYRKALYGVIHCTGGGQRKALKYFPHTCIRKENFLPLPPVFAVLAGLRPWQELFEVFNMGHRMELYVEPAVAEEILAICRQYRIDAQIVGEALPSDHSVMEVAFEGESWKWLME